MQKSVGDTAPIEGDLMKRLSTLSTTYGAKAWIMETITKRVEWYHCVRYIELSLCGVLM